MKFKFSLIISTVFIFISLATPALVRAESEKTLELLNLFGDVFEKVREEYVEKPDDQELIEAAINGMLTHLDPHSSYLSKRDYEEMQVQTKGEFGGLGIEVTMENGLVKVVSPIDDTPAHKAGIKAGDFISHIDNQSVIGMALSEAVEKMRGKPNSKIILTIMRESEKEPFDVTIVRDVIKITSVKSDKYGDVAYLRITSFSEKTAASLEKELDKQKDAIGDKLKGVVLDLRNNPGGLLDQAIAVSDVFLDQGEIVSTRGRLPDSTKKFAAETGDSIEGLPIVVLINAGSASASEIVAGALQDHDRAIIMGTKSFGKGSVQTIIPLPGDGAMRLTTSRYYTPSGNSIQATGITPDVEVEPAKIEIQSQKKRNIEASLPGHLDNGNKKSAPEKDDAEDADKKGEAESLFQKDYQLARAVDLISALHLYDKGHSATQK